MKIRYYTIGEILRGGLLKNHKGKPYTNRGTLSRIVNKLPYKVQETPFGTAKVLSSEQIKKYNEHWKQ